MCACDLTKIHCFANFSYPLQSFIENYHVISNVTFQTRPFICITTTDAIINDFYHIQIWYYYLFKGFFLCQFLDESTSWKHKVYDVMACHPRKVSFGRVTLHNDLYFN